MSVRFAVVSALVGSVVFACSGVDESNDMSVGAGVSAGGAAGTAGSSATSGAGTGGTGTAGTGTGMYTPRGPEPQAILALTPDLTNGGTVWRDQSCETCHGPDGKGVPALGSDLTIALMTKSDLELVDIIYYGATPEGNPLMVAFGGPMGSLTDQQVADVYGYIKSTFGGGI